MRMGISFVGVLWSMCLLVPSVDAQPSSGDGFVPYPPSRPVIPPAAKKEETKKPALGSLEEQMDRALKNNPEIRRAEAKVHEAEAELLRTRRQILAEVEGVRTELKAARSAESAIEEVLLVEMKLLERGTGSPQAVSTAKVNLAKFKVETAKLEARLLVLLGGSDKSSATGLAFSPDGKYLYSADGDELLRWYTLNARSIVRVWGATHDSSGLTTKTVPVQASMAERLRTMLDKPLAITEDGPTRNFRSALNHFLDKAKFDIKFLVMDHGTEWGNVELSKAEMPVGAWLQLFEDSTTDVRFVIRDYGILVTTKDRVPHGAMLLHDFWKRKETPKATDPMVSPMPKPVPPSTGSGVSPIPKKP